MTPSRLVALAWVAALAACAADEPAPLPPNPGMALDAASVAADQAWFDRVRDVATGDVFDDPTAPDTFDTRYTYLGLRPEANSFVGHKAFRARYLREARLGSELPAWSLFAAPALPHIDCIVVTTIHREGVATPYLYNTLRSTFDAFPDEVVVNLAVGSPRLDDVDPARLALELGPERAARVRVFAPRDEEAAYLAAHFGLFKRGAWNYTRALLGYQGRRGLLVIEDDILWAKGAGATADALVGGTHIPLVSLYNSHCEQLGARTTHLRQGDVTLETSGLANKFLWNLQALYVAPYVAGPLGRYMLLRMDHPRVWDALVGFFVMEHNLDVAYAYPSLAQHVGKITSGCTPWEHQSSCFKDDARRP